MSSKKNCFHFLFVITRILTKGTKDMIDKVFVFLPALRKKTPNTTTECIKSAFWQNTQHDLKEHLFKKPR